MFKVGTSFSNIFPRQFHSLEAAQEYARDKSLQAGYADVLVFDDDMFMCRYRGGQLIENERGEEDITDLIMEVVAQLNPSDREDHYQLVVKVLRKLGWDDNEITLYMQGDSE